MKIYFKFNFKNLLRLLGSILTHILSTIWHYIRMYVCSVLKRIIDAWEQDGDHRH